MAKRAFPVSTPVEYLSNRTRKEAVNLADTTESGQWNKLREQRRKGITLEKCLPSVSHDVKDPPDYGRVCTKASEKMSGGRIRTRNNQVNRELDADCNANDDEAWTKLLMRRQRGKERNRKLVKSAENSDPNNNDIFDGCMKPNKPSERAPTLQEITDMTYNMERRVAKAQKTLEKSQLELTNCRNKWRKALHYGNNDVADKQINLRIQQLPTEETTDREASGSNKRVSDIASRRQSERSSNQYRRRQQVGKTESRFLGKKPTDRVTNEQDRMYLELAEHLRPSSTVIERNPSRWPATATAAGGKSNIEQKLGLLHNVNDAVGNRVALAERVNCGCKYAAESCNNIAGVEEEENIVADFEHHLECIAAVDSTIMRHAEIINSINFETRVLPQIRSCPLLVENACVNKLQRAAIPSFEHAIASVITIDDVTDQVRIRDSISAVRNNLINRKSRKNRHKKEGFACFPRFCEQIFCCHKFEDAAALSSSDAWLGLAGGESSDLSPNNPPPPPLATFQFAATTIAGLSRFQLAQSHMNMQLQFESNSIMCKFRKGQKRRGTILKPDRETALQSVETDALRQCVPLAETLIVSSDLCENNSMKDLDLVTTNQRTRERAVCSVETDCLKLYVALSSTLLIKDATCATLAIESMKGHYPRITTNPTLLETAIASKSMVAFNCDISKTELDSNNNITEMDGSNMSQTVDMLDIEDKPKEMTNGFDESGSDEWEYYEDEDDINDQQKTGGIVETTGQKPCKPLFIPASLLTRWGKIWDDSEDESEYESDEESGDCSPYESKIPDHLAASVYHNDHETSRLLNEWAAFAFDPKGNVMNYLNIMFYATELNNVADEALNDVTREKAMMRKHGVYKEKQYDKCGEYVSVIEFTYFNGTHHGAYRECAKDESSVMSLGFYKHGIKDGFYWRQCKGQSFMVAQHGSKEIEGVYLYPNLRNSLHGTFDNERMTSARYGYVNTLRSYCGMPVPVSSALDETCYTYDPSSSIQISKTPLVREPYEQQTVYIGASQIPFAGEGIFAKRVLCPGELISLFNGTRMHEVWSPTVVRQKPEFSDYRIGVNGELSLDISKSDASLENYRATLGHKTCHSFTPNAKFDTLYHPRFGIIMSIVALSHIAVHEEVLVNYNYSLAEAPVWFRDCYFQHLREENVSEEKLQAISRRLSRTNGMAVVVPPPSPTSPRFLPCGQCSNHVGYGQDAVSCDECKQWYHLSCAKQRAEGEASQFQLQEDIDVTLDVSWKCKICK